MFKNNKFSIIAAILLFYSITLYSQKPKVFKSLFLEAISVNDKIFTAINTDDFRLTCMDTLGNIIWQRAYGGAEDDWIKNIIHVTENGTDYLLWCGTTESFEPAFQFPYHSKGYVIKTNLFGDTLWTRIYDRTFDINFCYANDSNYIFSLFNSYGTIIKVDRNTGDTLWTRKSVWQVGTNIGLNNNFGNIFNSGDGFYVSGTTYPVNNAKIKLMKTDTLGKAIWIKAYGDTAPNIGWNMTQCLNGDFLLIGQSASGYDDSLSYIDFTVLRVDLNGDTIWTRRYCHLNWPDIPYYALTVDDGFAIYGSTKYFNVSSPDQKALLIKIDNNGNLIWANIYPGGYQGSLSKTTDGFIFVDGFLHITDSLGYDCTAIPAIVTVASSQITIDTIAPRDSSGLEYYFSPPTQEFPTNYPISDYCLFLSNAQPVNLENNFDVYPNPASSSITIELSENLKDYCFLNIYDGLGNLTTRKPVIVKGKFSLATDNLSNGMYLIVLKNREGKYVSKKVIIQK